MKTHQEKLNELTTEIRKAIPRLMELSEGCEIISKTLDYFNRIEIESNFIIGKNAEFDGEDIVVGDYFYSTDNFTIIGNEPLLNDVLEYFLEYTSLDFNTRQMAYILASWDLSKSKLNEQSPELINFLHDLIQNK